MVRSFLDRARSSDTMLQQHRERGGRIPCVRHSMGFDPRCSAHYTDHALASTLPEDAFVVYRASQDEVVETRIWTEHHERFVREVARVEGEMRMRQETRARDERATAEALRRRFPGARQCPRCGAGPVINLECPDLASAGRSANTCGCGFYSASWHDWRPMDWDAWALRAAAS